MSKTSSSNKVTLNKTKLMRLIYQHEQAIRDYAYARGVKAGLQRAVSFDRPVDKCITDYAVDADVAEAELYDFINHQKVKGE